MRGVRTVVILFLTLLAVVYADRRAAAVPTLQLYIEGATYDPADESWTITGVSPFTLWVLGETDKFGTIFDVKLTAAFSVDISPGTITLVPTAPSLSLPDGTVLLPSPAHTPSDLSPVPIVTSPVSALRPSGTCGDHGTVGTIPCMGSGAPVARHGEFGADTRWIEFDLGDFTLTTDPIGDYIDGVPTSWPALGEIKAYEVSLSGFPEGTVFHFDAFDHIVAGKKHAKSVFAPFSHDAVGSSHGRVPMPSGLLLMLSGLTALTARVLFKRG